MTAGEHEAITTQPVGITGVVLQHLLEQQIRRRRQGHGRTGVTISGVLDSIGCQGSQMPHGVIVSGGPGQGRKGVDRHTMTLANQEGLSAEPPVDRLFLMSAIAENPPAIGGRERLMAHVALTKPRIVELLLVTAVPTMFLAAQGLPNWKQTVAVLIGGTLAAMGANTLNSVYDRDIDALMHRTDKRPAAMGLISVRAGLFQGFVLSIASAFFLWWWTNLLAAVLALLAIFFYAVGYTMWLKRRTPQNIVWGGAAGCMPVLIAWSAVTGSLSWTPIILFLVVFFWTPPHYWPLAMKYKEDYANAGIPMLPVLRTDLQVSRQIITYSWVMVAVSLLLVPVAPMGIVYTVSAIVLGAMFIIMAYQLQAAARRADAEITKIAMRLFHWSISYLALLFLAVAVDPFVF